MVRRLSAIAAGFAVLTGASLAHAQRSASFGDQGEFVISADRLMPFIGYTHSSAVEIAPAVNGAKQVVDHGDVSSLGFFWGSSDVVGVDGATFQNPYTVPRVGFDYTILPNVTVGGDVVLYFTLGSNASTEADLNSGATQTTSGPGSKYTIFGIAPRAGYIFHVSELLSVWARGGLSYYTETLHAPPAGGLQDRFNVDQLSLDLDPQLVVTPIPHLGFTAGVTSDIPLTGGHSETQIQANTTSSASAHASLFFLGVTGGVFVWF